MIATLRGIKKIEYTKRDTGEYKEGLELHAERPPYATEDFVHGSDVMIIEYFKVTDANREMAKEILSWPIGSEIDLLYVQSGKYSKLADVHLVK